MFKKWRFKWLKTHNFLQEISRADLYLFSFFLLAMNHHGKRIIEIANKQKSFSVPSLLLSDYLVQFR